MWCFGKCGKCGRSNKHMEIVMGIQKAIVAMLGAIVTLVSYFTDLEPEPLDGLVEPISAIVTAILVWVVPNKEKPKK